MMRTLVLIGLFTLGIIGYAYGEDPASEMTEEPPLPMEEILPPLEELDEGLPEKAPVDESLPVITTDRHEKVISKAHEALGEMRPEAAALGKKIAEEEHAAITAEVQAKAYEDALTSMQEHTATARQERHADIMEQHEETTARIAADAKRMLLEAMLTQADVIEVGVANEQEE